MYLLAVTNVQAFIIFGLGMIVGICLVLFAKKENE